MMPRDVSTRWNSTYDMVEFAAEYRAALDIMTADRDMKLRKFELSKKEWGMVTELCEVLQVCFYISFSSLMN
jgi:predicted Co/Zn/Cd cation transporter (cation efflux family)